MKRPRWVPNRAGWGIVVGAGWEAVPGTAFSGNDGLSADRPQDVIEGVNRTTVAAGQILGVQHVFSAGARHVGQCELVGKQFCGDDGCH